MRVKKEGVRRWKLRMQNSPKAMNMDKRCPCTKRNNLKKHTKTV